MRQQVLYGVIASAMISCALLLSLMNYKKDIDKKVYYKYTIIVAIISVITIFIVKLLEWIG